METHMISQKLRNTALSLMLAFGAAGAASAANTTSYYLFDGDSSKAWEIKNGVVVNTFSTYSLGYPVAIRSSIWLGQRDAAGAREYTLGGVATGATSAGSGGFSQLLDGAAGANNMNYGVECCGGTNSVTVANADWTGQQVLFNLNDNGAGIAYNGSDNTLYVSHFNNTIDHYSLNGNLLGSFNLGRSLVGLAWESSSNSMWGWDRNNQQLVQFSGAGSILQNFGVAGIGGNPWGGEMAFKAASVPEPGSIALLGLGLLGVAAMRRSKK